MIIGTINKIIISNENCTLEDINFTLPYYCIKLDNNVYKITKSIVLKDNSYLTTKNETLILTGKEFQIEKGSTLQSGEYINGLARYGSNIIMKNLDFVYGFGNKTKNNSGNLKLYATTIDAFCYWGFFEGNNLVEIIDTHITGFGRVSGKSSIIKNVIASYSHGSYGFLATKGQIKTFDNIKVLDSKPLPRLNDNTTRKVCQYFNPKYSGNMVITNSKFGGYETFLYMENDGGTNYSATFIDCEWEEENFTLNRNGRNSDFYIKYTFNPIILYTDGNPVINADVSVYDIDNNLLFNTKTDNKGMVDIKLTYYKHLHNKENGEYVNLYNIKITKDDLVLKFTYNANSPLKGKPIYLVNSTTTGDSGSIDYDRIKRMINSSRDEINNNINIKHDNIINIVSDYYNNIISETEENREVILSDTGARIII